MKLFSIQQFYFVMITLCISLQAQSQEQYRPKIHFSPEKNWMNDPNGMVYSNGTYHFFYQYYPDKPVWGPMHWAHATSKDLVHWSHQPVALYPDSLGYIFSGSAVVDKNNTSGFGKNGKAPLVAIFTYHDPKKEAEKTNDHQTQSLAYSNDDGKTWIKYAGNPVLKNPGIPDFRDPKVMWYEPQKKWIMTLATKDRITFYSSLNLKDWNKESEFGAEAGAHGGVWECPDLFALDAKEKKVWILIVNINPGGPNGGSGTQYFLGDFDGKTFTASHTDTRWLDYGPDEYAGITWSNTGNRKIFFGWMSNWQYAERVPTTTWRGAATIPRELTLKYAGKELFVASQPVKELAVIEKKSVIAQHISLKKAVDISQKTGPVKLPCKIKLSLQQANDFSVSVENSLGEKTIIGYDKTLNQFYIDRTQSGKTDFEKGFAAKHIAPRFSDKASMNLTLIVDVSSVELFADDGLTIMTEIFFPNEPYNKIYLQSGGNTVINKLEYTSLKSTLKY